MKHKLGVAIGTPTSACVVYFQFAPFTASVWALS